MESYFNLEELNSIMKDFNLITHIRITVFDADYKEITSYPAFKAPVCQYLRQNPDFDNNCHKCDKEHMNLAAKMKEPLIYNCHAGITEIISPLFLGEKVIGYLFFSHILNYADHQAAIKQIHQNISIYKGVDLIKTEQMICKMPLFNNDYLKASARLLHETASFLIYNRLAYLKYEDMPLKIDRYIKYHLASDLSAKNISHIFGVGKTALYEITGKLYGEGLANHVRKLRIEKAKDAIRENGNTKVSSIAEEVGFTDYSYFIVAFKKETGMTPKKFSESLKS